MARPMWIRYRWSFDCYAQCRVAYKLQDWLKKTSTISDVKKQYQLKKKSAYPSRQSYRLEPKGKSLKDEQTLNSLGLRSGSKLYFKDLGPQVGWSTVFLTEYFGPLVIYLIFYVRPSIIYGADAADQPRDIAVHIAAACWTFHYAKRLLETIFVHRFSHATMPIMNIFKYICVQVLNVLTLFSVFTSAYLLPSTEFGNAQLYGGLAGFLFAEYGNWRIHMAFRNLRTPGTKERRIPNATGDPMTILFNLVTCPNYTYETIAWVSFSVMTQCLPALVFGVCGFVQMAIWAKGKHRNYLKEFKNYPRGRKAILPFLI
ncbi:putative very-long-chain enoyl-CoA reductase art-1-like [Apostichopus japonicus]|uniref:very-long-chain enoyl-CoA reductase n=1 Tax=Stichopus japonicus TaxID=307972 RepID=A0A2G8JV06_STIJA|nr:putative very-long-chain enoyl-CoA reductase art-1-like [Apostichopus japonicus]